MIGFRFGYKDLYWYTYLRICVSWAPTINEVLEEVLWDIMEFYGLHPKIITYLQKRLDYTSLNNQTGLTHSGISPCLVTLARAFAGTQTSLPRRLKPSKVVILEVLADRQFTLCINTFSESRLPNGVEAFAFTWGFISNRSPSLSWSRHRNSGLGVFLRPNITCKHPTVWNVWDYIVVHTLTCRQANKGWHVYVTRQELR